MNPCPYCHAQDRPVKNGRNASGSQRFKCQRCGRKYTPEPTNTAILTAYASKRCK